MEVAMRAPSLFGHTALAFLPLAQFYGRAGISEEVPLVARVLGANN
jgi:hypothetical protein